jgi:ADP-heptose:LPS heptosyltransferase
MLPNRQAVIRWVAKLTLQGSAFRRYAPQSQAARPRSRLRIAIVSLIPHLGDSVMLFPLLDAVRQENPTAEISVFTAGSGGILSDHPAVDHLYLHKRHTEWWRRSVWAHIYDLWTDWRTKYRDLRFDICVVPRGGVEPFYSAHLAWMLGGRVRAGYNPELEPELFEANLDAASLFTIFVTDMGGIHEVTRGVEILTLAGVLKHPIDIRQPVRSLRAIAQSEAATKFLSRWPTLKSPYAVIAPGASTACRRWSPAKFIQFAQTEIVDKHITPVLIGSIKEQRLCESIADELGDSALVITGTTFVELAALCLGAQFFVGNDSGPGHVAGSLGVPTVLASSYARSGSSRHQRSPMRAHPCGPFVNVVQPDAQLPPCSTECEAGSEHCIGQITCADMASALSVLFAAREATEQNS